MHCIKFVEDQEMPEGHDFILVETPDGALLFYREGALTEETLMDSWSAYRALRRRPPVEPTRMAPVDAAHVYWREYAHLVA